MNRCHLIYGKILQRWLLDSSVELLNPERSVATKMLREPEAGNKISLKNLSEQWQKKKKSLTFLITTKTV